MYFVPLAEPDAFGDLRPGIAVYGSGGGVVTARENVAQARPGGSECSRRENHVAGTRSAAAFDMCVGGAADGGDVDRDACRRAGGVAPGERYAEFLGQLSVTLHELFGPRSGRIVGQRE